MSKNRVNNPLDVVSVNDIVKVYVYEIDEAKGRVQLSLLPLDVLAKRDADKKEFKSRKKAYNKPQRKEISEEEAMKKLLDRFGFLFVSQLSIDA